MASYVEIEGMRITGNVYAVLNYVCDLQDTMNKSREQGRTLFYAFHGDPEQNNGEHTIGGLLVSENTKVTFFLEAPEADAPEIDRAMFDQEWEMSDVKHVVERVNKAMESNDDASHEEDREDVQPDK